MIKRLLFGALTLSPANAYLLPDETENFVYADTRIVDPRYARSVENLVCVTEERSGPLFNPISQSPNGAGGYKPQGASKIIPIGCCPSGDPTGTPFGPGKACCCGKVYHEDTEICCEASCKVYTNTLSGITKCNMDMSPVSTTVYPGHDPVKPEITERPVNPWENTAAPETTVAPYESGKCPKAWYVPSPMEVACTDYNNEGSFCSFSCPDNLKVRIPDNPNRLCMENKWQGDVPQCCERDGCPADLRVDFFFILDSSSSIKDKNFQFIREYVIGLIATMPIGLDKTRVGIITYNNEVEHRIRLDQFDRKSDLMKAVNDIPYEGRGTKTDKALEYAYKVALTAEMGDRPDVPNFVLVLTDGRSTDDVNKNAPKLREKAAVIAVGVGKRIEPEELELIAGEKSNVFMVADFRSLAGSGSGGDPRCAEAQIEEVKEVEEKRFRRDSESNSNFGDSDEEKLAAVEKEIIDLEDKYNNNQIGQATYFSETRRLQLLRNHILSLSATKISNPQNKVKKFCKTSQNPAVTASGIGLPTMTGGDNCGPNGSDGKNCRFTTSFICPKSCVFDNYVLYFPDAELSTRR